MRSDPQVPAPLPCPLRGAVLWPRRQSGPLLGVGINPIVLSVLITVVIGVGLVTPPVGMCIYVACDLMDTTVGEVFPTLVPFIAATFVCIALMVAFPQLILLPTYLMA